MKERHKIIPTSHLILLNENKILLLRRFNTGFEDGNYTLVAGHLRSNETFTDAMIREAKEEANITLKPENLKVAHIMHRKSTFQNQERVDAYFIVKKWKGEIKNMEPKKCDDLSWFDIDNLPNNTTNFVKEAIKNSLDNKNYSEFGWK